MLNCNVKNSDFSKVTSFKLSTWEKTAWWQAKKLNKELAKYLIDNYKYMPKTEYFNKSPNDSTTFEKVKQLYE